MTAGADRNRKKVVATVSTALFAAVLVRTAWLCDDSFIIFRSVYNFLHGFGLRYNVAERVQAFTSPLWTLLLVPAHAVTGEAYVSTQVVSILLSVATAALVAFAAPSAATAFLGVAMLVSSKAFVDFSSSGLENPLLHFLLVLFFLLCTRDDRSPRSLLLVALSASLVMTTRMDAGLLVLPTLAVCIAQQLSGRRLRDLVPAFLGFLPFLLWSAFSLFYYGFLFPNSAYAKLGAGVSTQELVRQGFFYVRDSVRTDHLTLAAIAVGAAVALFRRNSAERAAAAGIALYLAYVVRIGGDFMSGRFFAAPLLVAALLISRRSLPVGVAVPTAFVALLAGLSSPHPSLLSTAGYGMDWPEGKTTAVGIADERAVYYERSGLLRKGLSLRRAPEPPSPLPPITVMHEEGVGGVEYDLGPAYHVVDSCALVDPLLARLPCRPGSRIGHFMRDIPTGYLETLESGRNRIADPALAAYYDKLAKVVRGDLFDPDRLTLIGGFLCGRYSPPR